MCTGLLLRDYLTCGDGEIRRELITLSACAPQAPKFFRRTAMRGHFPSRETHARLSVLIRRRRPEPCALGALRGPFRSAQLGALSEKAGTLGYCGTNPQPDMLIPDAQARPAQPANASCVCWRQPSPAWQMLSDHVSDKKNLAVRAPCVEARIPKIFARVADITFFY